VSRGGGMGAIQVVSSRRRQYRCDAAMRQAIQC
jgi:hypothetical protein